MAARGYQEFRQYYLRPGWVEHLPEDIWQATLAACRQALSRRAPASAWSPRSASPTSGKRRCCGTGDEDKPRRAPSSGRTGRLGGDELREAGVRAGQRADRPAADPYFTGTKLTWLATEEPATWAGLADGSLAAGTVDSYLIVRLTGGKRTSPTRPTRPGRYCSTSPRAGGRPSCASCCGLVGTCPEVVPSTGIAGRTDPAVFLGLDLPIAGIAGDQQAALFGQACFAEGDAKCTYGTGSFVLANTGATGGPAAATGRCPRSRGWTVPANADLRAGGLGVRDRRSRSSGCGTGSGCWTMPRRVRHSPPSVPDSGGVVFVPALTGLERRTGDPGRRASMFDITSGTTRAHLVRATLEAIALRSPRRVAT